MKIPKKYMWIVWGYYPEYINWRNMQSFTTRKEARDFVKLYVAVFRNITHTKILKYKLDVHYYPI